MGIVCVVAVALHRPVGLAGVGLVALVERLSEPEEGTTRGADVKFIEYCWGAGCAGLTALTATSFPLLPLEGVVVAGAFFRGFFSFTGGVLHPAELDSQVELFPGLDEVGK
ncbi:hypothetical protein CRG98_006174 [Punica granatum]|uniref:Uncharacterized protein n=1 Tax=Punica granatum TaxID=22663 RepID=A0A2I0KY63_PUNGR|nr:hypothetical protein CRG98_006174 [Punica granatum]